MHTDTARRRAETCPGVEPSCPHDGHRSSSPDCHEMRVAIRHRQAAAPDDSSPAREQDRHQGRSCTRLLFILHYTQLTRPQPSASWCGGRPCGRPAHAPAQARPQFIRRASRPRELLCSATDTNAGDAGSIRWIAFLGRACRRHRQLLSTQGNGGVFRCLLPSVSCLSGTKVNPS